MEVDDALDDFAYAGEMPESTKLMAESLRAWLARFDDREREAVVESVFRAIEASGADDAGDLLSGGSKSIAILVDALEESRGIRPGHAHRRGQDLHRRGGRSRGGAPEKRARALDSAKPPRFHPATGRFAVSAEPTAAPASVSIPEASQIGSAIE